MVSVVMAVAAVLAAEPKVAFVVHAGDAASDAEVVKAMRAELGASALDLSKVDAALFPKDPFAAPSADLPKELQADWKAASDVCKAYPTLLSRSGCAMERSEALWSRYLTSLGITEVIEAQFAGRGVVARYDPRAPGAVQQNAIARTVKEFAEYLGLNVRDVRAGVGSELDRSITTPLPKAPGEKKVVLLVFSRKDISAAVKAAAEKDGFKVVDATEFYSSMLPDMVVDFSEPMPRSMPPALVADWKTATERCVARVGTVNKDTAMSALQPAMDCAKQRADYLWAKYLARENPLEVLEVNVRDRADPFTGMPEGVEVTGYTPRMGVAYAAVQEVSAANALSALPALIADVRNAKGVVGLSRATAGLPAMPKDVLATLEGAKTQLPPVSVPANCEAILPSALNGPDTAIWKTIAERYAASVKTAKVGEPVSCKVRGWSTTEKLLTGMSEVVTIEADCGGKFGRATLMTGVMKADRLVDKLTSGVISNLLKSHCGKKAPAMGTFKP